MLNTICRSRLLGGLWLGAAAVIVAASVAMGARASTSAFLLAAWAVPAGVVLVIGLGASPPTVAELLYAVNNPKGDRS
jgi:hypothetical protein